MTASKFEPAFTRCRNNLKTVRDLTVKNSLQDFDITEAYLHLKSRSVSYQKCQKFSVYIIVACSHNAVSNLDRLGFRFQNLPFSKSAGKKCAVFKSKIFDLSKNLPRQQNVPSSNLALTLSFPLFPLSKIVVK